MELEARVLVSRPGLRLVRRPRAAPGRVDHDRRPAAPRHDPRSADQPLRARRATGAAVTATARPAATGAAAAASRCNRRLRGRGHGALQRPASAGARPRRDRHRRADAPDLSRAALVATHARSTEPFARVVDPAHYAGLWRHRSQRSRPLRRWPSSVATWRTSRPLSPAVANERRHARARRRTSGPAPPPVRRRAGGRTRP